MEGKIVLLNAYMPSLTAVCRQSELTRHTVFRDEPNY